MDRLERRFTSRGINKTASTMMSSVNDMGRCKNTSGLPSPIAIALRSCASVLISREIQLLTDATNQVMQRLQHVLDHQKRFVRDVAQLVVTNSGSGISEDMRQRLFQPFATGDTKSGTGLGLAIAREIVHALGGTIQLNNRIVGGEVVGLDASITLPLDGGNKIEES